MTKIQIFDDADIARETARILIETESVLFNAENPFTYTSGRVGPCYIDCRRLISFPRARGMLMDFAASQIVQSVGYESLEAVAGGETAGIPFAAWVSERMELPMLYVRKKPKGFGRMAQIEGVMNEGDRVILVEDLQTDGGSKKLFIDAMRNAGAKVSHTFVVFHYGIFEASRKNMEDLGLTLLSLTDWRSTLKTARDFNYFDAKTLKSVEAFLDDPVKWSVAHGGKGDDIDPKGEAA